MKKILLSFFFVVMSSLLARCITIPLGDNVLEISTDGINFESVEGSDPVEEKTEEVVEEEVEEEAQTVGEDDALESEPVVEEEEPDEGSDPMEEDDVLEADNAADEEVVDEETAPTDEGEVEEEQTAASANECEEHNNSRLTDELITDFYIPDCAVLTSMNKTSAEVRGSLEVENGDWEQIYDNYHQYFGENLDSDNLNLSNQRAQLSAKLYDDDRATRVEVNAKENLVEIHIIQILPDEN